MKGIVIAGCIIAMLAIWPISLVRRDRALSSMAEIEYSYTQEYITETEGLVQRFQPQTSRLEKIAVVLGFYDEITEGRLNFVLLDENNKIIVSHTIEAKDLKPFSYYDIPVKKWVDKDKIYTYRITADKDSSGKFFGVYTGMEGTHAQGSIDMRIGGQEIVGQAVTSYTYGYPLNVKNVICLWAFGAEIGMILCSMIDKAGRKG